MKKLLVLILFLTTFISCEKKEPGNLKYARTITGGCFLDKGLSAKNDLINEKDTVTYSVNSDSLNIFVGFNASCCGQFSDSSSIKGDSILINILTTQIGMCNCLCYYTYNFRFSGNADSYFYLVSIDDNKKFAGQIKP